MSHLFSKKKVILLHLTKESKERRFENSSAAELLNVKVWVLGWGFSEGCFSDCLDFIFGGVISFCLLLQGLGQSQKNGIWYVASSQEENSSRKKAFSYRKINYGIQVTLKNLVIQDSRSY